MNCLPGALSNTLIVSSSNRSHTPYWAKQQDFCLQNDLQKHYQGKDSGTPATKKTNSQPSGNGRYGVYKKKLSNDDIGFLFN